MTTTKLDPKALSHLSHDAAKALIAEGPEPIVTLINGLIEEIFAYAEDNTSKADQIESWINTSATQYQQIEELKGLLKYLPDDVSCCYDEKCVRPGCATCFGEPEARKFITNLTNEKNRLVEETKLPSANIRPGPWETFQDASYFDMQCVRMEGERRFGGGFHLVSAEEAGALCDTLNRLTREKDAEIPSVANLPKGWSLLSIARPNPEDENITHAYVRVGDVGAGTTVPGSINQAIQSAVDRYHQEQTKKK